MEIVKNRVPDIQYMDDQLCICGSNHILQENLFIIPSSIQMIATSIMFKILNVAVFMTVCWLAGNTHKLAHRNWGAPSISCVFDILHISLNNLLYDITLIHNK